MKVLDDERCIAMNLKGTQCCKGATMGNLCVIHYEKKVRYKVETIKI